MPNTTRNYESPYEQIVLLAGTISILKKNPGFESFKDVEEALQNTIDGLPESSKEELYKLVSEINS